jgi:hypothetical protein
LLVPTAAAAADGDDELCPVDAFAELSAGVDAPAPALLILLAQPVSRTATNSAADTRDAFCFIAVRTVFRTAGAAMRLRLASDRMASAGAKASSAGGAACMKRHSVGSLAPPAKAGARNAERDFMIILGIILLLIGFLAKIAILWTLGIFALLAGLILLLLGSTGRAVRGRRHYW